MGNPARQIQEEGGMLRVERISGVAGEELACVIERHQHHDEAAQHVNNRGAPAGVFRSWGVPWVF